MPPVAAAWSEKTVAMQVIPTLELPQAPLLERRAVTLVPVAPVAQAVALPSAPLPAVFMPAHSMQMAVTAVVPLLQPEPAATFRMPRMEPVAQVVSEPLPAMAAIP